MRKTVRRIPALLLCLLLLVTLLPVRSSAASLSWSLSTLDGETVTNQTYAGKTQLLIFYRGRLQTNGSASCYYSGNTFDGLGDAYWYNNDSIQVIAVESDRCTQEETQAFADRYAAGLDRVVFAYGNSSLIWQYWGYSSLTFSVCVILQDGEVKDMWDGNTNVQTISRHLAAVTDIGADPSIARTTVTGEFRQSEARSMLDMINDFRTGNEAWYWNADDETKTSYSAGQLGTLQYDYDLEKVAMQRAAELAVYYDHTRPDGSSCFDLKVNGTGSYGENIAYGYPSAEDVFVAWREDNDDYSGQGHRRNMLREGYTAVGFGCFYANNRLYWAQEFGYVNSGAAATTANDSPASVKVDYLREDFPYLVEDPTLPVITAQPAGQTVTEGGTATFTVAATGAESYQWYYRTSSTGAWTKVKNNGTSATYNLTTAARHNGYQYFCKVTNAAGSVNTKAVLLKVQSKPTITTQPKSVTVAAGQTAKFTVAAKNAVSYQWQYKKPGGMWTSVSKNGKAATYSLTAEERHNGYLYRCKVTNEVGTTISSSVALTVSAGKPTITTQPTAITVAAGKAAKFTVAATGAESYQWQYKIPGGSWKSVSAASGKTANYSLTAQARHNGYLYRCKVKNAAGTTISEVVTLTVQSKPTITTQPKAVSVTAGKTAKFTVTATGADSYQWQYKKPGGSWTSVSAASGKTATYSLTAQAKHNGYQYRCKVKNAAGTTISSAVALTVSAGKPVITTQPRALTVAAGKTA